MSNESILNTYILDAHGQPREVTITRRPSFDYPERVYIHAYPVDGKRIGVRLFGYTTYVEVVNVADWQIVQAADALTATQRLQAAQQAHAANQATPRRRAAARIS